MREVPVSEITRAVAKLCREANELLPADIRRAMETALPLETSARGREILSLLLENAAAAAAEPLPICQDTGMALVFVELGQDVHLSGGDLSDAVNAGVRDGYRRAFLRNSVVRDPLDRVNTGDNTPAVIHLTMVPGENIRLTVMPKGFGSENMSRLVMLKPADGPAGIKEFVVETVRLAGGNPCPPVIVGVGIGGTMEKAALLAKTALLRPVDCRHSRAELRGMEDEILAAVNSTGIGPQGLGGRTTALAVNIEVFPTHIAGLPVAVNIGCHATRHATVTI